MLVSIQINNLGKRFVNEWIFKGLTLSILPGEKLVIKGANGSGKSTLLQSIASFLIPTKGEVVWKTDNRIIEDDTIFKHLSMASPYMELTEDFTLKEAIHHQQIFKGYIKGFSYADILNLMQLEASADKQLKNFSSGMKQRVKLGLAILADCPVLLLDEPCSNLDHSAIAWYQHMIHEYGKHRTVIVCSNAVKEEYLFCNNSLEIENYKPHIT